jgi:hypothetical protein
MCTAFVRSWDHTHPSMPTNIGFDKVLKPTCPGTALIRSYLLIWRETLFPADNRREWKKSMSTIEQQ